MQENARIGHIGLGFALSLALTAGCAAQTPALYPNVHYEEVGAARAQADVAECTEKAKAHGLGGANTNAGERAVEGAVIGAASGAAGGAVRGNAGIGAGAGAARRGTSGLMSGLFRSQNPDQTTRRFIEKCLRLRGYETIGWR